jgi:hypothetical protein
MTFKQLGTIATITITRNLKVEFTDRCQEFPVTITVTIAATGTAALITTSIDIAVEVYCQNLGIHALHNVLTTSIKMHPKHILDLGHAD